MIEIDTLVLTKSKQHIKLSKDTDGKLSYVKFVNNKQIEQLYYEHAMGKIKLVDLREKNISFYTNNY